jgi:hypothetical protein
MSENQLPGKIEENHTNLSGEDISSGIEAIKSNRSNKKDYRVQSLKHSAGWQTVQCK